MATAKEVVEAITGLGHQGGPGAVAREDAIAHLKKSTHQAGVGYTADSGYAESSVDFHIQATLAAMQMHEAQHGEAIDGIIREIDKGVREELREALGLEDPDADPVAAAREMRAKLEEIEQHQHAGESPTPPADDLGRVAREPMSSDWDAVAPVHKGPWIRAAVKLYTMGWESRRSTIEHWVRQMKQALDERDERQKTIVHLQAELKAARKWIERDARTLDTLGYRKVTSHEFLAKRAGAGHDMEAEVAVVSAAIAAPSLPSLGDIVDVIERHGAYRVTGAADSVPDEPWAILEIPPNGARARWLDSDRDVRAFEYTKARACELAAVGNRDLGRRLYAVPVPVTRRDAHLQGRIRGLERTVAEQAEVIKQQARGAVARKRLGAGRDEDLVQAANRVVEERDEAKREIAQTQGRLATLQETCRALAKARTELMNTRVELDVALSDAAAGIELLCFVSATTVDWGPSNRQHQVVEVTLSNTAGRKPLALRIPSDEPIALWLREAYERQSDVRLFLREAP